MAVNKVDFPHGALVTGLLFAVAWLGLTGCDKKPGNDAGSGVPVRTASGRNESRPDAERAARLRAALRAAKDDSGLLAENLDYAISSGLLPNDPSVDDAYRANLYRFDAGTLAKLTTADVGFGGAVVTKLVAAGKDAGFVRNYYSALPDGSGARKDLMQHLGADSPLLVPENAASFIDGFPALSADEASNLGWGLEERITIGIKDPGKRLEAINAYLSTIAEPAVLEGIAPAAVGLMDLDEAVAWLENLPENISKSADIKLMQRLNSATYAKGFDFINGLLAKGQTPRAQKAGEQFLFRYAAAEPRNAVEWVLGQDKGFVTHQMVSTAYLALYRADPEGALQLLETIPDAARKNELENLLKRAR